MVLKSVDFSQFLSEDSGIPFDIKFEVIEEVHNEVTNEKLEVDRKTVEAQRLLLSAASPVFKQQFFGKMRSSKHHFEIKETKIKAFELFIQIIYGAENLNLDIKDMFEILDLADFYIIEPIKGKMIEAIKNEMTFENLKTIADAASTYIHHEELANGMLKNCGKFLQSNLGSSDQILDFLKDELMEPELIDKIIDLKCENCDYFKCKDSMLATFPEHKPLRPGVKVKKWIRTGDETQMLECSISTVSLAPIPPNLRPNKQIDGGEIVLALSDGSEMRLPLKKMSNNEFDHWYSSPLSRVNFLSTGGMIFRCKDKDILSGAGYRRITTNLGDDRDSDCNIDYDSD
eukprot:GFUD01040973.1.p1 GENE.GFUD01040973.1~~GFUD01040973.1.p1  ORF type:complete len:344 (+),score=77.78 GFUD01040973.1:74-1105(+)